MLLQPAVSIDTSARVDQVLAYHVGQKLFLHGLASQQELNGAPVAILDFDPVSARYGVKITTGHGGEIRVKEANVSESLFWT